MYFQLPLPPTQNNMHVNRTFGVGFGRVKSYSYRKWLVQADKYYTSQRLGRERRLDGPYSVDITFPEAMRGDLDGRVKAVLDWCVSRKLVVDDSPAYLRGLNARFGTDQSRMIWVKITPITS